MSTQQRSCVHECAAADGGMTLYLLSISEQKGFTMHGSTSQLIDRSLA